MPSAQKTEILSLEKKLMKYHMTCFKSQTWERAGTGGKGKSEIKDEKKPMQSMECVRRFWKHLKLLRWLFKWISPWIYFVTFILDLFFRNK